MPYGSNLELMLAQEEEVCLSGPAGTGKSRACLEKLDFIANQYPGSRQLIVRKTRTSLNESGLVTYEEKVLPANSLINEGADRPNRQKYDYPNGSVIVIGGMDKATRIMSTEYDVIYVQEAIELTEEDWENLTTRLRNNIVPYQQIISDTNPGVPTHWLKKRCNEGRCRMIYASHKDNPVLYNPDLKEYTDKGKIYISRLGNLTGARRERLKDGKWVGSEGLVFSNYDERIHLIDRFDIPADWRRVRGIDFGFTNPFVCQWWAIDPDGRMYLYREIYKTKRVVNEHAKHINKLSEGERIEITICDHDAEDRAQLEKAGIRTKPAYKAVSLGIQNIQERLKVQPDGKPRIFILRDSLVELDRELEESKKPTCTAEEMTSYSWPKSADGKNDKEEPIKEYDHGCDDMRYVAAHLDKIGQVSQQTKGGAQVTL
ncbi:phage terminase large subunit [Gracilimonas sediminicola]|uniref:Phage terminase large subunit n=1 Tax=Gracilimonas sediminicola TaxID=2952158 RepID=A0A9X2REY2_9BACT|nr:phage terminase large subunit [Gracilimonas sediminicola]MCP9290009.1 phage terminase large subunit [Gracilimonas sediminicola]